MICPKCGRTIPDGTQCPCGAPVLSTNPAVNVIKTLGSSPKFLAAVVLYSVGVLFSLLAAFGTTDLMTEIYYYGANFGVDPDVFYPMMNVMEGSSVVLTVLSMIPSILIAVGMWMFYTSCRNTQSGNVSTAGLTICKVLSYIGLVFVCLLAAIVLIVIVIAIAAIGSMGSSAYYYYEYSNTSSLVAAQVLLGVVAVIFAAIIALMIVYYVCIIKVINRIKASAINGVADNRIPRFMTGLMMVMGVLGGLSGLASLITSPVAGIGAILASVCMILMSLLLSEYRTQMTMLLFPPVQPMYGQNMPPYTNVPPQAPPQGNPPQQPGGPTGGYPQQ